MRKIIEFLKDLWEQLKNRRGEFLVIYTDSDNNTQHRFRFADENKAKKGYKLLRDLCVYHSDSSQPPKMMVEMFRNGHIIEHYDTWSTGVHPIAVADFPRGAQ